MFIGPISRLRTLRNIRKPISKLFQYETSSRLFSSTINTNIERDIAPSLSIRDVQLGQPTSWTHPHLLRDGEIVPGIAVDELKARREKLMNTIQSLAKLSKNHLVIIPSATKKYMTGEIPYVFRQNSDFFYYTGCLEPNSILVMWIDATDTTRSVLFMRPNDKNEELWDGPRTGIHHAVPHFGVDEAHEDKEFRGFFERYIQKEKNFRIWFDKKSSEFPELTAFITGRGVPAEHINSATLFMHRQRVIKSPSEIQLMRKTCEIASNAINQTMRDSKPGDSEHHVFARVDYYSRMNNASFLAYPPVVAAGNNANAIHYIYNSQIVKDGEMVLMDAGCEYGGYSSDITRTWPINGSFTPAQQTMYDVILTLQKELIDTLLCHGGNTLNELFGTMGLKLGFYLQEVGLISKSLSDSELARAVDNFCPHHVSHYLGMDIHDTPLMSRNAVLEPGMVFTMEPGLYISRDRKDVPEEFRGIGIRIEDDILIKPDGSVEILTAKCIKEKDQLVNLINSK